MARMPKVDAPRAADGRDEVAVDELPGQPGRDEQLARFGPPMLSARRDDRRAVRRSAEEPATTEISHAAWPATRVAGGE